MADDYKDKLDAFLKKVPQPGQVNSGSPQYKPELKAAIVADTLTVVENPDFKDLTGLTHKALLKNWAGGGIMTSCNGLVGTACRAMGAPFLGAFELEKLLRSLGKGHAWVSARSGERPQKGDVFTAAGRLHMGVSLGFDGDTWLTVEGGQGGPSSGFDIVKRKSGPFNPGSWEGWCDMRVFLDSRGPVPDWLPGWWVIYHGGDTYNYHFNRYYEVSYSSYKPGGGSTPTTPTDVGTFKLGPGDSVTVTWRTEGGTEQFTYDRWNSFPGIMERMTGTGAKGEPLKGVRM